MLASQQFSLKSRMGRQLNQTLKNRYDLECAGRCNLFVEMGDRAIERDSQPFQPHVREVAKAGSMRVVLSQKTAMSTMWADRVLPDIGIDADEVDPLVEPPSDRIVAGVGDEVGKAADVFVVARLQLIAPDYLHGALLAPIRQEP
jgi:hypothetical protein